MLIRASRKFPLAAFELVASVAVLVLWDDTSGVFGSGGIWPRDFSYKAFALPVKLTYNRSKQVWKVLHLHGSTQQWSSQAASITYWSSCFAGFTLLTTAAFRNNTFTTTLLSLSLLNFLQHVKLTTKTSWLDCTYLYQTPWWLDAWTPFWQQGCYLAETRQV